MSVKGGGRVNRRQEADPMQLSRMQLFCFLLLEGKWVMGGGKWVMCTKLKKGAHFLENAVSECQFPFGATIAAVVWRSSAGEYITECVCRQTVDVSCVLRFQKTLSPFENGFLSAVSSIRVF